ncbi:hypothetical protein ACTEZV_004078 [Yersinia enterocolitica]
MSKIERYAGNLHAFGSNAQGLERTLFGETTQADDLTSQVTNSFLRGWGIVGPSENPSMEDFNAAMYTMSQFIAYQHQMGIPEWDALQEYYSGSICVRNGEAYLSLVDSNIGSAPPSAKWTSVLTAKNALANISGFLKISNNLSDLTNVPAALLNLGLGDAAKLGVATDAEVIAGLVGKAITAATLKSRFASVVLYPSGTEAVPPTLTAGQRIVIDNPFPGRPVSAEVEVFANGIWDSPNIMVAPQGNGGPSAGAKAKYLFDSDKIVIQTAGNGVLYLSIYSGSAHNFLSGGDVFSGTIFSARQYRLRVRTL